MFEHFKPRSSYKKRVHFVIVVNFVHFTSVHITSNQEGEGRMGITGFLTLFDIKWEVGLRWITNVIFKPEFSCRIRIMILSRYMKNFIFREIFFLRNFLCFYVRVFSWIKVKIWKCVWLRCLIFVLVSIFFWGGVKWLTFFTDILWHFWVEWKIFTKNSKKVQKWNITT